MMHDQYMGRKKNAMGAVGAPELPEFDPPSGLELKGSSGTASVQWRKKPDGAICITAMDGVSLDGSSDPEPDQGDSGDTGSQDEGSMENG